MSSWHYTVDGQAVGPIPFESLRELAASGKLTEDTLVWTQGMPDWVPPSEIPGLTKDPSPSDTEPGAGSSDPENPYAAPASASNLAANPSTSELEDITPGSETLRIEMLLSKSWDVFKRNIGIIFGMGILYVVISIASSYLISWIFPGSDRTIDLGMGETYTYVQAESIPAQILNGIIGLFLGMGAIKFGLKLFKNQDASISDLFSQGHLLIRAIAATILLYLILLAAAIPGGAILFLSIRMGDGGGPNIGVAILGILIALIPTIYLGVRLSFIQYCLVDRDRSAIEAIKDSWSLTTNNVLPIILLFIVQFLIVVAGALALLVGLLIAFPILFLSTIAAYLYLRHGWRAAAIE